MKILVVDDSLMDRKVNMNIIKKGGFDNEILQAVNGEEAVKVVGEHHEEICLILLDWQMPVMDGLEFMKTIMNVEQVSSIPIVMITASGTDENKQEAYDVNPNLAGYLVKPYKAASLIEAITPHIK